MRRIAPVSLAFVAAIMLAVTGMHAARAQQSIRVISDQTTNDFPVGVSFSLSFSAPAEVKEVRLQDRKSVV